MSEERVQSVVSKILARKENGAYLVVLKQGDYDFFQELFFNGVISTGMKIICVTQKVPAIILVRKLKNKEIEVSKVSLIDCVSKSLKDYQFFENYLLQRNAPNCIFVENPKSLVELSIAINDLVIRGGSKFLFFDSIALLFDNNFPERTDAFFHYLKDKLSNLGVSTVFVEADEESRKRLPPSVEFLFDEIMSV